jgi:hypothetical protein
MMMADVGVRRERLAQADFQNPGRVGVGIDKQNLHGMNCLARKGLASVYASPALMELYAVTGSIGLQRCAATEVCCDTGGQVNLWLLVRFWLQAIAQTKKQLTPFEVNCLLSLRITHTNKVAHSKGFEPLTPKFVAWCSIQLSYECVFFGRRALSCKDEPKST